MSAAGGEYPAQTSALKIVKSEAPVKSKKTLVIVEIEGPAERVDRYVDIVLGQLQGVEKTMNHIAQVSHNPVPCPRLKLYTKAGDE